MTLNIATSVTEQRLPLIHGLLGVQAVVIILASINRLSSLTLGYVAPNEFLRWVDLLNMLPLPLISLSAFYLLKRHLDGSRMSGRGERSSIVLGLVFMIGVYLLGASYGTHEVTNYLHSRFCLDDESTICQIIVFNDDEFSHWVFFAGFVLVNGSLLLLQAARPRLGVLARRDRALLVFNGLFIAAGIVANLAFETIGLDLLLVILLALLALTLLFRRQGAARGLDQPLIVYYSTAYTIGLIATLLVRLVRG